MLPPAQGTAVPGPVIPQYVQVPGWYGPEMEFEEPGTPLSHYLWVLRRHLWSIVAFVVVCVAATAIVSSRLTPLYEATTTIEVDRRMPAGIIGEEGRSGAMWSDADQFLATQVRMLQSDSVLRPVVRQYKLSVEEGEDAALPSTVRENAPVKLRNLKVTRPPNTYLLLVSFRSPDPRLSAQVANAIASSYIQHTYEIRYRATVGLSSFMEKQLEELKAKMERSSAMLAQFEKELNLINPEEKTNILSSRLLQLNTEYTNAQAERVRKEAAFNSVRSGVPEAAESSSQSESLKKLMERLNDVEEKFAEVKTHFGANHPEYRRAAARVEELKAQIEQSRRSIIRRAELEFKEAANREEMLKKEVASTKAELDRLNARSFEYQALKREAEADKSLYEELVRKIKEAGVNASFQNSWIRVADQARPPLKPVFPDLKLNLVLAFLFSTMFAVGAAIVSDRLDRTVRDPEVAARTLNVDVLCSLPQVKMWRKQLGSVEGNPQTTAIALLDPEDRNRASFNDAVHTLLNSILLSENARGMKSLLVTSACPSEGKSTVAAHLASAHASQGYRTLLVDCDLRRPSVNRLFGFNGKRGLSQVISHGVAWEETVVKVEGIENLEILPAGSAPRLAAHSVGKMLRQVLKEALESYDFVVIDTPPVLGFAETLELATLADGVLLVASAGQSERKAVQTAVQTLTRLRVNLLGMVLNQVSATTTNGYYYYGYHGKYYNRYYGPDEGNAG